jgi:hypothetical protein
MEAQAAAILAEIRADTAADLSPALQIGLDARMEDAAAATLQAVETGRADDAINAWNLARHVAAHDRAVGSRARVERLFMATRLVSWLAGRPATAWRSMSEAATAYAAEGSFVDRARHAIRSGDALPDVAAAYARLGEAVMARREEENRAFAAILREWNSAGATGDVPLPVERVLGALVAPLAREAPVLLLVLDGLSLAVWRALAETVGRSGWRDLVQSSRRGPLIGAAVLPSMTEVSRASLLCGALTQGDQAAERAGFAAHTRLVAASRSGHPPRLFHKADLEAGPELSAEVRAALGDPQQRIVGVVHNAVDAQLSGSDQLDLTWTAEGLRQVSALLYTARDVGRIVVVTGDHGHVLDEGTVQLGGGLGDRWRSGDAPPSDSEIKLSGGRVLAPGGDRKVVAAWSERVRFAARRGGYHGGASPQEVLVPIAVLTASNVPTGWSEAPSSEPAWWRGVNEDVEPFSAAAANVSPPQARRGQRDARQGDFLGGESRSEAVQGVGAWAAPDVAWVDALLASETYAAQRRLAGRVAPADEAVRGLLVALAMRGGRMTRIGLSQALRIPTFRLGGLVSATRRVLNLDQAQVIKDAGDDIVLDEALLSAQFALGGDQ